LQRLALTYSLEEKRLEDLHLATDIIKLQWSPASEHQESSNAGYTLNQHIKMEML
jgi:hypothetical protein